MSAVKFSYLYSWINRDGKLLVLTSGLRNFGYGFLSIVLLIYLKLTGFTGFEGGLIISSILATGAAITILGALYADKIGRRRFLFIFSVLMALSGVIFVFTTNAILLIIGAMIGTLSPSGSEVSAYLSIEQAMLPNSAPSGRRNSLFATYTLVAQLTGAVGSLYGGLPTIFQNFFHYSLLASYKPIFASYAIVAVATALLYIFMSDKVELGRPSAAKAEEKLSPASRSLIARMTLLFGIDAFAGGFIIQTVMSYWFQAKFGTPVDYIAFVFFVSGVLTSGSLIIAGKLADRFGAVNTMVFTHLPSNLLLVLVPLMPTFLGSISLYLARSAISLMDVPARQSYTVSVVKSRERLKATSATNISRNAARAASPTIAGYAFQFVSLSFPFFISGILYTVSDLGIYASFRKVKPIEEIVDPENDPAATGREKT